MIVKNLLNYSGIVKGMFRRKNISVFLDTTNGCNLRCNFCSRESRNIVQMNTSEVEIILGKLDGRIASLQLSCAWEYSIAKNAAEIIRTIAKFTIPTTTIYTNGNILSDDIAEALIDARLNEFVVSIGEAKEETYERLRQGGKFERVLSNIRKLYNLKKERNSSLPRICTNLTLVNSNIGELLEFIDLANSVGVEQISGRHLILNEGLDMSDELIRDKDYANNIIAAAEKKSLGYGMSFSVPRYEQQPKPKSCRAPWQQLYISSNGDVSVCPRIHMYAKVGNLMTDTLRDIARGSEMTDLKRQFNESDYSNPVCGVCMENRETECAINQGF